MKLSILPKILTQLLCVSAVHAQLPEKAWILPTTWESSPKAGVQQKHYYDFMWRSFIAVNWPNVPIVVKGGKIVEGYRGKPVAKENAIFEQKGAAPLKYFSVWETYREPATEIFLPPEKWEHYPKWNSPRILPSAAEENNARAFPEYFHGMLEYATAVNQPDFFPNPTGPLIDQNGNYVRYEVAANEAFFTYIKHFRYYNPNEQTRAVAQSILDPSSNAGFQRPPYGMAEQFKTGYLKGLQKFAQQGMVDVKAAWRVLDPAKGDRPERYLHRHIYTGSGEVKLMGLVALHILRFAPSPDGKPGQVASTFEQVDNVEGTRPSFNDGSKANSVQKSMGFEGAIPAAISEGETPPKNPKPVSIYRVTPIPVEVQAMNTKYQEKLKGSVFQYYQLIGTQNKHPGDPLKISFAPGKRELNGHQGPTSGVFSNTNNLINVALESYTQKNHSCLQCHIQARPVGVPTQAKELDQFKTLTFLLQAAKTKVPSSLGSQEYLGVRESLASPNGKFIATLHQGGNFCVNEKAGKRLWCSGETGSGSNFHASTNQVGQFCIHEGTPQQPGNLLWCSPKIGPAGDYFATMTNEGRFCVMKGIPKSPKGTFWCNP